MSIRFGGDKESEELKELRKLVELAQLQVTLQRLIERNTAETVIQLTDLNSFMHQPRGVIFVTPTLNTIKGDSSMADLVLAQNESEPVELHYVDANGNDLGIVPASDSPSISGSDPATLQVAATGGSATLTNINTGTADVDDTLNGSAKGFSTSAIVTCKGTGVTPPPTPSGVKFVFPSTVTPAPTAAVRK